MVHRVLGEVHVQRLWHFQAFRTDRLIAEDGRRVEVLFPGIPGVEGGPDFRAARVRIGGREELGDVEIHLTASEWRRHGHARDGAYSGVVLHVLLDRDGRESPGPALVLRPHLTASAQEVARGFSAPAPRMAWPQEPGALLEAAGRVRWERRILRHRAEAGRAGESEALHRAFFTALGYRRNRGPFRELARLVPAASLEGLGREEILRRLREGARGVRFWRRRGVRPANAPERRMEEAAAVLAHGPVSRTLAGRGPREAAAALIEWGGIGRERAEAVAFHAILPASAGGAGAEILAGQPPLRTNLREREALALAPPAARAAVTSVLRQMGLLELRDSVEFEFPLAPEARRC